MILRFPGKVLELRDFGITGRRDNRTMGIWDLKRKRESLLKDEAPPQSVGMYVRVSMQSGV